MGFMTKPSCDDTTINSATETDHEPEWSYHSSIDFEHFHRAEDSDDTSNASVDSHGSFDAKKTLPIPNGNERLIINGY